MATDKTVLDFVLRLNTDQVASAKLIRELNAARKELVLLSEKGEITGEELAEGFNRINNVLEKTRNNLNKTTASYSQVVSAQQQLFASQQKAITTTKGYANATNNANQILFSFGDAAQDAAQFQFGLAQGLRAVSNNLAFAAEQYAYTSKKAGGFKETMKALGASLTGAGGIIIGINLALTALTFLTAGIDRARRESEDLDEKISDLTKSFLELSKVNKLNTTELLRSSSATNTLATRFEQYATLLNNKGFKDLAKTYSTQAESLREQGTELTDRISQLTRIAQIQSGLTKEAVKNRFANISNNESQLERLKILQDQLQLILKQDKEGGILAGNADRILDNERNQVKLLRRNLELRRDLKLISDEEFRNQSLMLDNRLLSAKMNADSVNTLSPLLDITGLIPDELDIINEIDPLKFFQDQATQAMKDGVDQRLNEARREMEFKKRLLKEEKDFTFKFYADIASIGTNLASIAFGKNKAIASAAALVDTYLAAQKAYTSQLTLDPTSPVRAQIAAAAAIASGLARVASINRTQIGSTGGGSASSGGGIRGSNTVGEGSRSNINAISGTTTSQSQFQPISLAVTVDAFDPKKVTLTSREGEKLLRLEQT